MQQKPYQRYYHSAAQKTKSILGTIPEIVPGTRFFSKLARKVARVIFDPLNYITQRSGIPAIATTLGSYRNHFIGTIHNSEVGHTSLGSYRNHTGQLQEPFHRNFW